MEIVAGFEAEMGVDPEFRKTVHTFMMGRQFNTKNYFSSVKWQNDLGGATTVLKPVQIAEYWPTIETNDLTASTFDPEEGCVNGRALMSGCYAASMRGG